MTIEFECGQCGKELSAPDSRAGWRARCPDCRKEIVIPRPASVPTGRSAGEVSGACPMCGTPVMSGVVRCPECAEPLETLLGLDQFPLIQRGEYRYAGFWLRGVAAMIDGMVLIIPLIAVAFVMNWAGEFFADFSLFDGVDTYAVAGFLWEGIAILAVWLYFALMESSATQGTLGKMALGLIVTDTHGRRVSFLRATGRHFGKFLSHLICYLGFFMAAVTEQKQALHDILSECLVIRRR